ncbi:solute carrier family 13 (sodium-dependent dicarboxylate transporter), member 2/3/5 [Halogranum amylolyticum]|uniref:Solute carrier family 13 (Sodium-dependent dicarboxylate transporter), member 2/3/5 n=1 Tax=Halogranum amylolyticum TaxID=660520 RepID=A0A1H8TQR1_9EURY|nr:DASS family sodium-coupled anion symporter [Halogranum amylolyticum]SEO93166.1 solute carrier family 13 (sodium-dependent dicarboxylate transporter), member 2/3/5 [Halogranum amylolyticum]
MIRGLRETTQGRILVFAVALLGALVVGFGPSPEGLSLKGQYALATMFFAAVLWVTGVIPLAVTALSIPVLLTAFGVYSGIDPALAGFADHLIFLFIAGFMLANALQKYDIDRRIALWIMSTMGASPRLLILSIMLATAVLSMWVSNTATTAMMTPIALGVLAQVLGRDEVKSEGADKEDFSNMQIATLLGTAYAASVGGVGTLIGTPPNAVVATQLSAMLGYEIGFAEWLLVGMPIVAITLPLVWYALTFVFFPPEIDDVSGARQEARRYLEEEGDLSPRGKRVAYIFTATAGLWVLGGLDGLFEWLAGLAGLNVPETVWTTLFGGEGPTVTGVEGHQGLLYYVMVGLYAIPALVLADTVEWEDLVDIDWGTILLFGGGISLADAFATTGATEWIATTVFGSLTGAPIVLVVAAVVLLVIFLTEMTSNTATATIIVPVLIGIGSVFASTLGISEVGSAVFLSVSGAIAASFAFALPVATPPNAIVFGSGHLKQEHMMRVGVALNLVMTVILTGLIWLLFQFVWPMFLW